MRSIQECQAEVFRRSEIRIKARKKRRQQIITACLPLVLGICAVSALVLPELLQTGAKTSDAAPAMGSPDGGYYSYSCAIETITVEGEGICLQVTDTERTMSIYDRLTGRTVGSTADPPKDSPRPENESESTAPNQNTDKTGGAIEDCAGDGITVTVIMGDGSRREFLLAGDVLTDLKENRSRRLSAYQLAELRQLLGLDKP